MLYLMAAVIAQTATPATKPVRFADCKPVLTLASAAAPQRREETKPKRPKPCMVMASA